MNDNNFIKQLEKTGISKKSVEKKILKLNDKIKTMDLKKSNFRYYPSNINKNNSKNAYVTIIFGGDAYIPGILALGHSLRLTKTKYKLICMVQDKDEDNFKGLNKDMIDEINTIYDLVVGIDLLKTNFESEYFKKNKEYYKNIQYYTTKNQMFGLYDYDKILYLDASCIVKNNIDYILNDYIFYDYDISTYKYNFDYDEFELTKMGLHGNYYLIIPTIELYNKSLYLISNYSKFFENEYFIYSNDEIITFFTIYPEWNDKKNTMFSNKDIDKTYSTNIISGLNINYNKYKNNSDVYKYVRDKPFRFNTTFDENYLKNNKLINYLEWDLIVKDLIKTNSNYKKYFEYIKTFRETFF